MGLAAKSWVEGIADRGVEGWAEWSSWFVFVSDTCGPLITVVTTARVDVANTDAAPATVASDDAAKATAVPDIALGGAANPAAATATGPWLRESSSHARCRAETGAEASTTGSGYPSSMSVSTAAMGDSGCRVSRSLPISSGNAASRRRLVGRTRR